MGGSPFPSGRTTDQTNLPLSNSPAAASSPGHENGGEVDDRVPRTVLELLTGTWTAQAIVACGEFALPDRLAGGPRDSRSLATEVNADPAGLHRLLRFLVGIGVLAGDDDRGYRNTELGDLLRGDVVGSMRDLTLVYGGPFYRVWGHVTEAVRTGHEQFSTVFGKTFFEYLEDHPDTHAVGRSQGSYQPPSPGLRLDNHYEP